MITTPAAAINSGRPAHLLPCNQSRTRRPGQRLAVPPDDRRIRFVAVGARGCGVVRPPVRRRSVAASPLLERAADRRLQRRSQRRPATQLRTPTRSSAAHCLPPGAADHPRRRRPRRRAARTRSTPTTRSARTLPKLGVGGVLLTQRNVHSADQVRALTAPSGTAALARSTSPPTRRAGRSRRFRPVLGPSELGLLPRRRGRGCRCSPGVGCSASFLRGFGVHGDLAPVADVTSGPSSAIGSRSFSADAGDRRPPTCSPSPAVSPPSGVVAAVKHFPGLGRPDEDTHTEVAVVDASAPDLEKTDLAPVPAGHRRRRAGGDGRPRRLPVARHRRTSRPACRRRPTRCCGSSASAGWR